MEITKLLFCVVINFCFIALNASRVHESSEDEHNYTIDIRLNHVVSEAPDSLVCTGQKLKPEENYIVAFTPHASKKTAHHMMVYGCKDPGSYEESWACRGQEMGDGETNICGTSSIEPEILFAWALDAPEKKLPEGVGLRIGGTTNNNYAVVQLHYARAFENGETDSSGVTLHITKIRPPMQTGYYIHASYGKIPPQQEEVHIESACPYKRNYPIFPIGFRTHAHNLGVVTAGYRIRNGKWLEIGRMSPQLPQTFYNVSNPGMDIRNGDILAARCTMNSMSRRNLTYMGPRNRDEMCNFYILYATYNQENLEGEYCEKSTYFKWSSVLKEFAPFPDEASSLDGIPHADRIREQFRRKAIHV